MRISDSFTSSTSSPTSSCQLPSDHCAKRALLCRWGLPFGLVPSRHLQQHMGTTGLRLLRSCMLLLVADNIWPQYPQLYLHADNTSSYFCTHGVEEPGSSGPTTAAPLPQAQC